MLRISGTLWYNLPVTSASVRARFSAFTVMQDAMKEPTTIAAHSSHAISVLFSPDDRILVSASGSSPRRRCWEPAFDSQRTLLPASILSGWFQSVLNGPEMIELMLTISQGRN